MSDLTSLPGELPSRFIIDGQLLSAFPYGSGHINDTFAATYQEKEGPRRYIHQRINTRVFRDAPALMDNVSRVTRHAAEELRAKHSPDMERRCLQVVPAVDGKPYALDAEGGVWRTYLFIEKARSYDRIETPGQAREAAAAFGQFQGLLSTMKGERLHETIPDFHNTRARFEQFREALERNPLDRARAAAEEISFARSREPLVDRLLAKAAKGEIPERITHNDTKLNNVMFDETTDQAICVIDLDTVMPGLVLYDFGDMVRTATSPAEEDEQDLSKVRMQMPMFEQLARGYLGATTGFLTPSERGELVFSGKLITFEIGLRFLADFLQGDTYFKTKRPGHNLDRCRTQFKLVESIEAQESDMQRLVDSI